MNIIHITAECYPIAKVGGLADVAGALPKYLNDIGADSSVIMPFYDNAFTQSHSFTTIFEGAVDLEEHYPFEIRTLNDNDLGFEIYFVHVPELLHTDYVYSFDDTKRFLAFQIGALRWIQEGSQNFDIVHCHDHHTGLVPFMMAHSYEFDSLKMTPSVLTIHNAQYQGWFSHDRRHLIPSFDDRKIGLLDWDGVINPLATAIKCAWRVTTVSPNYMKELQQQANGLESLLAHENQKCVGILNGIDTDVWNPETDPYLEKNYSKTSHVSGKKKNKAMLCERFGLDPSKPLFAFIGRLVGEKGAELLPEIFREVLSSGHISVLLLGSGSDEVERALDAVSDSHQGSYAGFIGYDEKLSHLIYAGADFLLMPSRVEPCGLNQMYSLRYGTIPIVHSVGGLKDTVVDIWEGGFGFRHDELTVSAVADTVYRAVNLFEKTEDFRKVRNRIMRIDNSWKASAKTYESLYQSIN